MWTNTLFKFSLFGTQSHAKPDRKTLEAAKQRSGFIANLFCRYSDALLSQVMQSVACNAFHPIEARAARWLLHAADRAARIAHEKASSLALL